MGLRLLLSVGEYLYLFSSNLSCHFFNGDSHRAVLSDPKFPSLQRSSYGHPFRRFVVPLVTGLTGSCPIFPRAFVKRRRPPIT